MDLVSRCCKEKFYLVETNYHSYYVCDKCGRPTTTIFIRLKDEKDG